MANSIEDSETEEFLRNLMKYLPETRKTLEKLRYLLNELLC
jgi:hypothetical protein